MTATRGVRSLPIRRWLAVAIGLVFFLPIFTTGAIVWHVLGAPRGAADRAVERLSDGAALWSDPAWQKSTGRELAEDGVAFTLLSGETELYRSASDPLALAESGSPRTVRWINVGGGDRPLVAVVYSDERTWEDDGSPLIPLVAITSFIVTIVGFAWFLGRTVVRPLAAASDAARRVAAGDLDVRLPTSRVREVEQLNASFEAMSFDLAASLHHQAELEQERRLFIGAIVHDLRTPLFSLRGYLDGLITGVADTKEKRDRYLAVAREKADALERLIADLFDFTRLEYLDQSPRHEPLDLTVLIGRLVDGIRPQAETKRVHVLLDDPESAIAVDGDAHLLTRALENLLDNAVRFTPGGGEVRVSIRQTADETTLSVADTGPGIRPDDLPHLFTPLFRGESSRNRKTGGAGLGLTIARRIFQAHGGDLTATNAATGGAVFRATLPTSMAPHTATAHPQGDTSLAAETQAPSRGGEVPLRGAGAESV